MGKGPGVIIHRDWWGLQQRDPVPVQMQPSPAQGKATIQRGQLHILAAQVQKSRHLNNIF